MSSYPAIGTGGFNWGTDVEPGGRSDPALSFLMFCLKSNCEGKRSSFWLKQKRLESSSNNNECRWKERRPGDAFVTSRWGHWPQLEHQSAANGLMPAQWHERLFTTVKCCFGHETRLTWTTEKWRATNKRIQSLKEKNDPMMSRATAAMPCNRSQTDPSYSQNIRAGESKTTHALNGRREQQRRRFRQTSVVRNKRGTDRWRWQMSGVNPRLSHAKHARRTRQMGMSSSPLDHKLLFGGTRLSNWREFKTERLLFKAERQTRRDDHTRVSSGLHAKTLQGKTVNVKRRPGLSWPVPDPR